MPLHTEEWLELRALHGLDDAVGRFGGDTEMLSRIGHGLMVEGVDVDALFLVDPEEDGVFLDGDGVRGQVSVTILTVLDGGYWYGLWFLVLFLLLVAVGGFALLGLLHGGGDVLHHLSSHGHGEGLYAAADAEDRYLPVVGQSGDEQFWQVTHGIDAVELW